jgi:hypothetical protein
MNKDPPPLHPLPPGADLGTHLTPRGKDGIRGSCMFVDNIFPNPFWIGFKRLSEQSHPFRNANCLEGFASGSIGGLQMAE